MAGTERENGKVRCGCVGQTLRGLEWGEIPAMLDVGIAMVRTIRLLALVLLVLQWLGLQ
jgi:hypothetical protein